MNLNVEDPFVDEPVLEKGFEFIDGRPVEKPMGAKSGKVTLRLGGMLAAFVDSNNLGHAFNEDGSYKVFAAQPGKVRKPDASFIARGRLPDEEVPEGHIRISPDLVVEVISPNDLTTDTEERIADYLGAGTRLIWIIHYKTRSAWVFRQDGTAARLTESQSLSGEDVIPGFTCPLARLFSNL
jgi:Uma2 family endonuclease